MKLKGKNIVITGGSSGFGLSLVEAMELEGARVIAGSRSSIPSLDISNPSSVELFVRFIDKSMDKVDVLINNAGVYGPIGTLEDNDFSEWSIAVGINLLGTAYMTKMMLPLLRKSKHGKIINISGGGATSPMPNFSAYASSKAGVVRLTETLSAELGKKMDINAVAPGAMNTQLLDKVLYAGPKKAGKEYYNKAIAQKKSGGTPMKLGTDLCVFLASRESDGITGRLISAVWDDWASLPKRKKELSKSDVYTLRRIVPTDRGLGWRM